MLISEPDQGVAFDHVLQTAREVTSARYAALGILNDRGDGLDRFLTSGVDERTHAAIGELPRGRGVLGALIADPRPLRLDTVATSATSHGFPAGHPEMDSFLGVPIMIGGRVLGNLYVTEKADGGFTEQDEMATMILAGWAAIAIENAPLPEVSEPRPQRAARATRALEVGRDAVAAISAGADLASVLGPIAFRIGEVLSATSTAIWLRDGGDLVEHITVGPRATSVSGGRIVVDSEFARALNLGRPLRRSAGGVGSGIPAQALGVADGAPALLVPMAFRGRFVGLLVAVDDAPGSSGFDDDDEYVLGAFAASAATAVAVADNAAKEHVRGELAAADAQRARWARELHDETLGQLRGLQMQLIETLRQFDGDPPNQDAIRQAIEQTQRTIDDLCGLISELDPATLRELGLQAALEALLERQRRRNGFELTCQVRLLDPIASGRHLPTEVESVAYRVLQEGLSNIVRHAGARQVRVTVRESNDELAIEVSDDGHGFEPAETGPGCGLTDMRSLVALTGGDVTVTSGPHGTLLRACLPLTPGIATTGSRRVRRPAPELGPQDLRAWVRSYGDAIRAADVRGATGIARDALTAGLSLAELHARVITPAMYWIGELWAQGVLTVADEHAATAISHDVMASVKDPTHGGGRSPGETVLLAAPGGEQHGLGLRMAADTLDAAGFRVIYLGVDVPLDSLIQTVAAYQPALTGVSLTTPRPPGDLRALTAAITAAGPDAPLLIGGQGVPEWLRDDRVIYISSVESLVARVDRLLATRRVTTTGASRDLR